MNIEDYREFCLSLGEDIEEKLPFQKFKSGEGVLVLYVMGHMFSFFDTGAKICKVFARFFGPKCAFLGKNVPNCALPTFFLMFSNNQNWDCNRLKVNLLGAERPGFEPGKRF